MSRNSKIVLSLVFILVVGIFVFRGCRSEPPPPAPSDEQSAESSDEQIQMAEPLDDEPVEATKPPPTAEPTPTEPAPEDPAILAKKFAEDMRSLQTCFSIAGTTEDSIEPTAENLDGIVQDEMGEVVAKNQDWASSYVETPTGEKRLIRTEVDYNGDEGSARKLKYFSVGPDGFLTLIPLSAEQSEPSDTLIASLEAEGKVTLRERNSRAYYANGGEASYLERDGHLAGLEVSYNGKTFRCSGLQTSEGTCSCHP